MNTLLLLGAVGGLLPDLLRLIKDPNSVKEYWGVKIISVIIQVALGVFAVWLLLEHLNIEEIPNKIIATSIGFTAPSLLTRILSSVSSLLGGKSLPEDNSDNKNDVVVIDSGLEVHRAGPEESSTSSNKTQKTKSLMEWWEV